MHTYINMTKVISISDDAYEQLHKLKGEKDSFTTIILRIVEKEKRKLASFAGALSEESAEALKKEMKEMRAVHRRRHQKRLQEMMANVTG